MTKPYDGQAPGHPVAVVANREEKQMGKCLGDEKDDSAVGQAGGRESTAENHTSSTQTVGKKHIVKCLSDENDD